MSILMKDIIKVIFLIVGAFFVRTMLVEISVYSILIFNLMNVVVIYFAVKKEEIFGACTGSVCGLIQDSFSLGVFGIAGLSKTVMGFAAGYISRKINIYSLSRNFVFIFLMSGGELILWSLLYSFIFSENINTGEGLIFFQPLGTAILGSLFFQIMGKIKQKAFFYPK